tara:strand:- start:218980 stop:219327 length:348 start_codon:yes stop_codon:yes gene_type:complete
MNNQFECDLLSKYVSKVIAQSVALEEGDSTRANRLYRDVSKLFEQIVSEGCRHKLLELLDHEEPVVRSKAAFHSLSIDPSKAESTLEAVSQEPGIVGFNAGMTLSEWRKGNLQVP